MDAGERSRGRRGTRLITGEQGMASATSIFAQTKRRMNARTITPAAAWFTVSHSHIAQTSRLGFLCCIRAPARGLPRRP